MGTKVQNLPGYYSMRDLNEESSSCGWPLFYGDKTLSNGQCYNNYLSNSAADACSVYDKDVVKRTMLEHEATFKNQVYELHRLYRIQKDLMNEFKRKESHRNQIPAEASFSTVPLTSQVTNEDGQKWHISGFPVGNSPCAKTSLSGVEGIHSPLGSMKGTINQTGPFPSPNGCSSSKDVEAHEPRASKVRRKMFDLQLPADEYIDTEESEKPSKEKTNGPTLFLPDMNAKEGGANKFCGNGGKTGSQEDTSRSEQSLRRRNDLADLNEPVEVDETYDSPCFQGAAECSDPSATAKQKSRFFGLSTEHLLMSQHRNDSWAQSNGYLENNGSGKQWISSTVEGGQVKGIPHPFPQVLKLEKSPLSSQPMQVALSKGHESSSDYLSGRSKADSWKEKTVSDLNMISGRNHEYSINKHPEALAPLHRPGLFAAGSSSDISRSWSHSASSWEMASSSLSQKLMSVQNPPCVNASGALSRTSQTYPSNGILENGWPLTINSKPKTGFRCDVPMQNGFYPGSSASKEPSTNASSVSYDYLNQDSDCKIIPEYMFNSGLSKSSKGSNSNFNGMKLGKDIDLNVLLSNGSSNNLIPDSGVRMMDGEQKHDEHRAMLPWLKAKTSCKNEAQDTDKGIATSLSNKDDSGKVYCGKFMHHVTSVLHSNNVEPTRTEVNESSSSKKILGVPIFDVPHISPKKELCSATSPSASILEASDAKPVESNQKILILDINMPCDDDTVLDLEKEAFPETVVSKTRSTTEAESRNQIDLNLSMSEDEGSFTDIPIASKKMKATIDLEAPPEIEEDTVVPEEKQLETSVALPQGPPVTVEQANEELVRSAAEAIVVLSSSLPCDQVNDVISVPSEDEMADPLSWFADVVSSCKDNPNLENRSDALQEKDGGDKEDRSSEELDYFETMTLNLTEMKEEDYLPKPLVPESFKLEEPAASVPTRTRKGPTRRGRQRRDFQRDILPGLVSLARHEVTEDLQTFGGLMKATGHSWSGLTRRSSSRNGGGRGRRRVQVAPSPAPPPPLPLPPPPPPPAAATYETSTPLMQQLNSIEVGLEDRSLTGWGKTTRRPRRQRCPAGNPPLITLT